MAAFLIVQRGEDIGRRFDLETTQLTVGRGSDNDMVLNDPMVSRYHAVVKRQGNGHLVIDLGSSNPVVINDQVCEPGEPRVLQHRDVVFIGKTVFSFQNRGSGSGAPPANRPQGGVAATQFSAPSAEFDSPTPPPPSRPPANAMPEARATPAPKPDPSTSPSMPVLSSTPSASPSFADRDESNDDRTMVAGLARSAEPAVVPFSPPPPPPSAGMRSFDDDSTRPTPGLPPMNIGTPPPPPPPAFAPPKPPQLGGPGDDNDGDMQTQIVPRRS